MKVKITDLMDLYEDKSCPLKPTAEQKPGTVRDCPRGENTEEVYEVKQSKYPFGWRQALSLAAVLGLLVLGGFGVKRLIDRSAAPVIPGGSGTDARIASTEHGDPSPIPLAGEEQKAISGFLSFFAMQQIQNYPEELSNDGALIHLAFLWRRYYDPESFTIREVRPVEDLTPEQAAPVEGLTPEQVNETLERLLGKTVTPPEDGADFDYSEQLGQPAGSTLFSAGCFWDNPTGKDASFFFALAEEALPLPEPGRETVRFNVYYVNYERWGTIDMAAMPALSTAEAEALEAEEKLLLTATGEAKLERTEDGYRLISYLTDGSQNENTEHPITLSPTVLKTVDPRISALAEYGVCDLEADLNGEYELVSFAHFYTKRHDPDAIVYESGEDGSYETLTLEQVNAVLGRLLGKRVSPAEGTDYTALRNDNYVQHETYRDGRFRWPAADGEICQCFALAQSGTLQEGAGRVIVQFTVYRADLDYLSEVDLADLEALYPAEAKALVTEGKLTREREGNAALLKVGDSYLLLSYATWSCDPTWGSSDTPEDLSTVPTGFDSVAAEEWLQFNGFLINLAHMGFPESNGDGTHAPTEEWNPDRFALATALISEEHDTFYEVAFEAYEADPLLWPEYSDIDPAQIEDVSEYLENSMATVIGSGTAVFERYVNGFQLKDYSFEDSQIGHPDPDEDPALRAEIEALFSDPGSWYARALSSSYARPEDVDLYLFFYDGIPGGDRLSNEELHELYSEDAFDEDGDFMGPPTDRMARAEMDKVLKQIFGLGLEESSKRGLDGFGYLEETDCYYHCHGDTNMEERRITAARRMEDGTVLFTYEDGFWNDLTDGCYPALHTAALRPDGAGNYLVVSNLPGEWVTAEDVGELSALFPLSGVLRAETRDADGTVTVRELDFGMDGEFHYREGDPNSEFSHWTWGKWWIGEDRSFRCALCETSESGNRFSPWRSVSFGCTYQNGELVLTQQSETGFADDAPGTELRFAPTAE